MRKSKSNLIFLCIIFLSCATKKEFMYPKIEELIFEPIKWEHSQPQRIALDNGMILYLLEDHELPIINGYIFIKAGSIYDEKEKVGLSNIVTRTLRTGGTKNITPEEIDSLIEYNAAQIEFYNGTIAISGRFSFLKENFDEMITIFADLLINPVFREDKMSVEIENLKEEIRRIKDSPLELAFVNFTKKLRKEHPTGWFPTIETVDKIKREDVLAFYNKYYAPNNVILAIVGDFNTDSLVAKINSAFGEWAKKDIEFPNIQDLEEKYERKVYYVEKETKQSTIIMGHLLSIYMRDQESYPLRIANGILGAGARSYLNEKIREQGLAYMVDSYAEPGYLYMGEFGIYCQTEAESTVKVIEKILNEVQHLKQEIDSIHFYDTKEGIKNRFVFQFESSLQIARNAAFLEFYNLPKDYYDKYLENIEKVKIDDVYNVVNSSIFDDKLEILVVGDEKKFDKSLSTLGKIEKLYLKE